MKRKVLQYRFNMIEVMLAIVIIAIGMASTFVLFPVGLNANKQAMAENSISDLAEYITAFVRAESQDSAHMDESSASLSFKTNLYCTAEQKNNIDSEFAEAIAVENAEGKDVPADFGSAQWVQIGGSYCLLRLSDWKTNPLHRSVYLVRQLSGPGSNQMVDFSAIAMVYMDVSSSNTSGYDNEYFPAIRPASNAQTDMQKKYSVLVSENKTKNNTNLNIQKFLLPLVLEISWPADAPISEREKRYFRFELFNGQYIPENETQTP